MWFPPLVVRFFCSLIKPPLTRFAHASDQRSGFRRDSALLGQPGAAAQELNTANLNANAANATNSSNTTNTGIPWVDSTVNPTRLFGDSRTVQFLNSLDDHDASAQLPPFIRPLPTKIASDDVSYLQTKGALTLPSVALQNALLQAHVEFVHPYMPLMDIHPFLSIVHNRDGFNGQTSLLLYHAVMFSGVAFVDMKRLREAGYSTRKAARKAFFQKTRVRCSKKKKSQTNTEPPLPPHPSHLTYTTFCTLTCYAANANIPYLERGTPLADPPPLSPSPTASSFISAPT